MKLLLISLCVQGGTFLQSYCQEDPADIIQSLEKKKNASTLSALTDRITE